MLFTIPLLAALTPAFAATTKRVTCAGGEVTAHGPCCMLFPVLEDIQANMFTDGCGDAVHKALRAVFNDAIGFSRTDPSMGGGADGSIFIFGETEIGYPENFGISEAFNMEVPFILRHNLSTADFLHFAGAVALSHCPGTAPQSFLFGRIDADMPAEQHLVPVPTDTVQTILTRMANAGFSTAEVVALLASHSIAGADDIDRIRTGLPLDSTPSIFDTQFFVETQLRGSVSPGAGDTADEVSSPISGEGRLSSDFNFARAPATACLWQANVNNQSAMASNFEAAFARLQVLGQSAGRMVDCSDVIPSPPPIPASNAESFFPPGLALEDVQQACMTVSFPSLPIRPIGNGPTSIPQITPNPLTNGNCNVDGTGCVMEGFVANPNAKRSVRRRSKKRSPHGAF